jgi:hypothetical protein
MQPQPTQPSAQNYRPALRVGLIAGVTLGLAAAAQQFSASDDMRMLGTLIIMIGFGVAGFFAARESGTLERRDGASVGAVSGLIAGSLVSLAFIAISLLLSLDPEYMHSLQSQLEQQVVAQAQWEQMQAADIDMRTLTQFSLGLAVACCGVGFPLIGLALGALGGAVKSQVANSQS